MNQTCCRFMIGTLRKVPSPFSKLVMLGYYDGPTDGLIECATCATTYAFRKIDWDDGQNLRVFALAPIPGHDLKELQELGPTQETPKWPTWAPNAGSKAANVAGEMCQGASPEEFIVAADDLLKTLEVWRPVGLATPSDWFVELSLPRGSM